MNTASGVPTPSPASPAGEPLASWPQRLAAYLIDIAATSLVVGGPIFVVPLDEFNGSAIDHFGTVLAVAIGINTIYHALFLRWRGATPGKWLLGLRVRSWSTDGRLSWSQIALRVGFQYGLCIALSIVYLHVVDGLWPLWDDKRQALHDKIAATCVVKVSAGGIR